MVADSSDDYSLVFSVSALRKSLAGQAENKQCTLCVVCQDADKNCV